MWESMLRSTKPFDGCVWVEVYISSIERSAIVLFCGDFVRGMPLIFRDCTRLYGLSFADKHHKAERISWLIDMVQHLPFK